MSVDPIHLTELVDLALCNPEVGAVNFNHLRTLLLQIIKLTNNEDAVVTKELNSSDGQNLQNESDSKSLFGNITKTKFEKLLSDHDLMKEKLNSLEEDLQSYNKFASNNEILKDTNDEDGNNIKSKQTTGEKLSKTWQHMKLLHRVEASEKGIDELFSLMNDILSQRESHTQKDEKPTTEENSQEKINSDEKSGDHQDGITNSINLDDLLNDINKLKEELNTINNKQEEIEKKLPESNITEDDNFKELLDEIKENSERNKNAINNEKNNLQDVQKSSKENKNSIKDLYNLLKELQDRTQQQQSVDARTKLDTDEKIGSEDINNLDKKLIDLQKQINAMNTASANEADTSDVIAIKEGLVALDKKLNNSISNNTKELEAINSSKAEASSVNEIKQNQTAMDKKINDFVGSLTKEVAKLKESHANMDNDKLKSITENFDQLQKMASEIDELRKLSDLKDLADNVDSLKDLRREIDALNADLNEEKQHTDDQNTKMSSVFHELNKYDKQQENINGELKKMKELFDLQKNFVDKESLKGYATWKDLKKEMENISAMQNEGQQGIDVQGGEIYEVKLSSGNDNLQEQLNIFKKTQETIVTNVNELLTAQMKNVKNKQVNERPPSPVFDVSVLAAIQHLAQQNRQQISVLQAELSLLKNVKSFPVAHHDDKQVNVIEKEETKLLATLQEYQMQLSGQLANMLEDSKDEFNRKQKHIDALYEHIDVLQKMKVDKGDMTSEIDVKADKHALDSKVSMSTFDERYQLLEEALRDALDRLDQFVEQEASLKDSLMKLSSDMDTKMDSDAEKKLKKFMENQLKDIQKARNNLAVESDSIPNYRNAAGLRKPMPLMYHCISCDRPVDISMRGVMSGATQNFPAKKSLGPYTSFELDHLRQNRKMQSYDRFNRPCGGQHTTVNNTVYRMQQQKNHNDSLGANERDIECEDLSITDCVVGKDGQIYRGRFKPNQLPPPPPKKIVTPSARLKYHSKHRFAYSANVPSHDINKESSSSLPIDETRSLSANILVVDKQSSLIQNVDSSGTSQVNGDHSEKNQLRNGSPLTLPPISRDGSLVGEDVTAQSNGSARDEK